MVITVSQYQGKFHGDGYIFVPYNWYNTQNYSLKMPQCQPINNYVKLYSNKQLKNSSNNETRKKHKLDRSKKCINYEVSESSEKRSIRIDDKCQKEELWTKQFSRWLSWNWQRKRKLLLSKFGVCQRNYLSAVNSKHQKEEGEKKMDNYKGAGEQKRFTDKVDDLQRKNLNNSIVEKLDQPLQFSYNKNISSPAELYIPIPATYSNRLTETCKSRRIRNKKNERIYEGWMREVQSLDSNGSSNQGSIKINKRKITHNEKLHYLSLRLRKLNSNELNLREKKKVDNECKKPKLNSNILILDEKMKTNDECNKSEIKSEKFNVRENTKTENNNYKKSKINYPSNNDHKKTEYLSPITGTYYDASLHKVLHIVNETNEADKLNSVTVADSNFIPTRDYNWMINFQLMKEEHKNFLNSINKAMGDIKNKTSTIKCKSNNASDFNEISNLKSDDSIKTNYYESDCFSNENRHQISLPSIVSTESSNDKNLIENIFPVKSKVIETICFKQIQGCSHSATNLPDFYFEHSIKKGTTHSTDYDLNYIRNHIDSFSSFITDTSFIINQLGW